MVSLLEHSLRYLTGPETAGRLSGTEGALRASAYLAGVLAELGLTPAGENGFFQRLDVPAVRLSGPAQLSVGGVAYRYRREFAELAHLSVGGSIRSSLAVVSDGDAVAPGELRGKAVLVPKRPDGFDVSATAAMAADLGVAALLVEWGEPDWFHKTLFGSPSSRIPVLRIRSSIAARLASQEGAPVSLDLPLARKSLPCRNVLGLLPGADPTITIALTAHYDHVGDDPGGERFPGAIDNASGVVTLLEVVRRLVSGRAELPFNLLVVFLTGEESGLWGAKRLAANPPAPLSAVVNLDGMGLEGALSAIRLGYSRPGNWLADLAAELYGQLGVEPRWIPGSDDSAAFRAAGLLALGLGQEATEPVRAGMHSPDDGPGMVDLRVIEQGAESILLLLGRIGTTAQTNLGKELLHV